MGTNLKDMVEAKPLAMRELKGKTVAVDTYNILYQFLASIRQRDGSPLLDSSGNVTSHLTGLFSRTTKLMALGITPVFVFDGESSELKQEERQRRKKLKLQAKQQYEQAKKEEDLDAMKKYAARTSRLTDEMVDEAKQLVAALGCSVVQAPGEGEAQAAYIVRKGDAYAVVSEDYDSLLFQAPRLVKNLAITRRKKMRNALAYESSSPQIISLAATLNRLGLDQEQLIVMAMLIGTDYNVGGIKGIGPKKAYSLVQRFGKDFDTLFAEVEWESSFDAGWEEVFDLFAKMPVHHTYSLEENRLDRDKVHKLLVEQHDFSRERIKRSLDKLNRQDKAQKGLGEFM